MLARLDPRLLEQISFPLGEQTKDETRAEAERAGLAAFRRAESQEACFLGGGDYRDFLRRHGVDDKPGEIVDGTVATGAAMQGSGGSRPDSGVGSGCPRTSPSMCCAPMRRQMPSLSGLASRSRSKRFLLVGGCTSEWIGLRSSGGTGSLAVPAAVRGNRGADSGSPRRSGDGVYPARLPSSTTMASSSEREWCDGRPHRADHPAGRARASNDVASSFSAVSRRVPFDVRGARRPRHGARDATRATWGRRVI